MLILIIKFSFLCDWLDPSSMKIYYFMVRVVIVHLDFKVVQIMFIVAVLLMQRIEVRFEMLRQVLIDIELVKDLIIIVVLRVVLIIVMLVFDDPNILLVLLNQFGSIVDSGILVQNRHHLLINVIIIINYYCMEPFLQFFQFFLNIEPIFIIDISRIIIQHL